MEAAPVLSVDAKRREEIERHVKALQSGDADGKEWAAAATAAEEALEKLADEDDANSSAIARRLVGLLSGGSANDQEHTAKALMHIARSRLETSGWVAAHRAAIVKAGGIVPLVALVNQGAAGGQKWAAGALATLACDAANRAAITAAGGIAALVALVTNGAAGGQEAAARALEGLTFKIGVAEFDATAKAAKAAIGEAGGVEALAALATNRAADGWHKAAIKAVEALRNLADDNDASHAAIAALVALVANGAAGGQETAADALGNLALDDANHAAIAAAGGVEALAALLAHGSDMGKLYAKMALEQLGPLAEYASRLQTENTSLQRRLDRYEGSGAIDVTQDDDVDDDAQHRDTGLRDLRERKLVEVKEEKVAAEGARDRNDAVAAAASAAAATATADAADAAEDLRDSQELTDQLVLSENNKMSTIDELRGTVSERDARIETLEAEAREKDATIAELRERVGQLERPAPRGGGRAKRPRT